MGFSNPSGQPFIMIGFLCRCHLDLRNLGRRLHQEARGTDDDHSNYPGVNFHNPPLAADRAHLHSFCPLSFNIYYFVCPTSQPRISTKCPSIAAAAAIIGLTKCVRLPLPWRPSKLRLEVE